MRVYLGQTRSEGWCHTLRAYGFGEMTTRREYPPRRRPYAFDNGAFKDWVAGKPFDVAAYEAALEKVRADPGRPDFLVVPDIVAGGLESLRFSLSWVDRLWGVAPLYLVVQDGMSEADVLPELGPFSGVFVGGSPAWKHRTAEDWVRFAHAHGLRCHIGRMGTEKKARAALRWGADSIDSCTPLWSETNLRNFLRGFEPEHQLSLRWRAA